MLPSTHVLEKFIVVYASSIHTNIKNNYDSVFSQKTKLGPIPYLVGAFHPYGAHSRCLYIKMGRIPEIHILRGAHSTFIGRNPTLHIQKWAHSTLMGRIPPLRVGAFQYCIYIYIYILMVFANHPKWYLRTTSGICEPVAYF